MDASPHFAPVVPPEVIGLIVDYLHDHPTSLKACGLVNHNFLASSRFHLYAGVSLTRRNLRAFLDSVKVPKNTWTVCLRSLHAAEFEHKDLIQLWPFLPTLSHLRSLIIHGHPITFDDNLIETQSIHSVRSLALSRATFSSFRGLTAFLLRFLSLRALKLDRISFQTTPPSASPVLSKALNLEAISMPLTPEMMAWLEWTKFSFRAELIELDVKFMSPSIIDYFRALGTHLRKLTLKFESSGLLASFSELSPLQYNTALRSIRVTQAFWIVKENDIRVSPSLARLLQHVQTCGRVEELALSAAFMLDGYSHLSRPQEAAEIIDGVGFARLQRIDFYGPWDTTTDILATQFRTTILALLPVQHARGIVHIGGYKFE
ncbi:hypothetical protein C8R43DRAFT_270058 [Mycena crocata]|nr:hypothetical protein C8R43DRAFT_270058 [Mycena crocata]